MLTQIEPQTWRLTGVIVGPDKHGVPDEMVMAPRIFFTEKKGEETQANEYLQKRVARFLNVEVQNVEPLNTRWTDQPG